MYAAPRSAIAIAIVAALSLLRSAPCSAFDLTLARVEPFSTSSVVGRCDSIRPSVRVENNSPITSATFQVSVSIRASGGALVYGPVVANGPSLQPGTFASVALPVAWLPASTGEYLVVASVDATGDINRANDTLVTEAAVLDRFIDRAQAIATLESSVIATSPYRNDLVAWLDGASGSDSLLMPGDVVAPWDSSFVDTIVRPTYFFWIDNEPAKYWLHSSSFVFVDACTGTATTQAAESWPVINGEERLHFDGNPVHGQVRTATLIPRYTMGVTANDTDCALIIAGENREGWDSTAILNDIERAKESFNGAGPHVSRDNTIVVGADSGGPVGATRQQVLDAIRTLGERHCRRVYIYYAGHGYNGGMVLKKPARDGTEKMSYADFGDALLAAGIQEIRAVIMACHSGSAIEPLRTRTRRPPGGGRPTKLKGIIITSSSSDRTTSGSPDGSPFTRTFLDALKRDSSDANHDHTVSFPEALAHAVASNDTVRDDRPQVAILDDGKAISFPAPTTSSTTYGNDGGGSLVYTMFTACYDTVSGPGAKIRFRCRRTLCVENQTGSDHHAAFRATIVCFDARGRETTIGTYTLDIPRGGRVCLGELPEDCERFEVRRGPKRILEPLAPATITSASVVLSPGDPVFIAVPIDAPVGHRLQVALTQPPGWMLAPSATELTLDGPDSAALFIEGMIPDTALSGGAATLRIVDLDDGDTSTATFDVLLYDSVGADLTSRSITKRWIDLYARIAPGAPGVSIAGSVVVAHRAGVSLVDTGRRLTLDRTLVAVDPAAAHAFTVRGELHWTYATLARAGALELDGATADVDGGAIVEARGDALALRGDQSSVALRGLDIDGSARDGLVLVGTSGSVVRDVRLTRSGRYDLRLDSLAHSRFVDGAFDTTKLAVSAGSRLERAWTTGVVVSDTAGRPVAGAIVEWRDGGGTLVGRDTARAEGLTPPRDLIEFVQDGATRQHRSSYRLAISAAGRDTVVAYEAHDQRYVDVVLAGAASGADRDDALTEASLGSIAPNPASGMVRVPFTLARAARVRITIVDMRGREALTVCDRDVDAGEQVVWLDAGALAPGAYLCRMEAGGRSYVRALVIR
jgi:hypothetical protein